MCKLADKSEVGKLSYRSRTAEITRRQACRSGQCISGAVQLEPKIDRLFERARMDVLEQSTSSRQCVPIFQKYLQTGSEKCSRLERHGLDDVEINRPAIKTERDQVLAAAALRPIRLLLHPSRDWHSMPCRRITSTEAVKWYEKWLDAGAQKTLQASNGIERAKQGQKAVNEAMPIALEFLKYVDEDQLDDAKRLTASDSFDVRDDQSKYDFLAYHIPASVPRPFPRGFFTSKVRELE